jgi:DNA polymerase I-like protein with 3'-5' exonuclease and polymerase domains
MARLVKAKRLDEDPFSLVTVYDAAYLEAPEEEAEQAREILKQQMEAAVEMPVVFPEVDIE